MLAGCPHMHAILAGVISGTPVELTTTSVTIKCSNLSGIPGTSTVRAREFFNAFCFFLVLVVYWQAIAAPYWT